MLEAAALLLLSVAAAPPEPLATLTLPVAASGDEAGRSIAFDGRRVLLGAPNHDAAAPNAGAAQVFRLTAGGTWVAEALLVAPDALADDSFGLSVAIDGEVALVGALDDDVNGKTSAGSAHIYRLVDGTWTHEATLLASDAAVNDQFGRSVAIRGDIAIVGSWQSLSAFGKGAAYVFKRQANGTWLQAQKLAPPDAATGDANGTSVTFDGTRAVVGAFGDDVGTTTNQGSASVFRLEPNGSFVFEAKLVGNAGAFEECGRGVALDDTLCVVGSWPFFASSQGGTGQGAAYVFRRTGNAWTQEAALVAPDAAADDYFGFSVACRRGDDGDLVACGAWADDVGRVTNQGSVWLFRSSGAPATWSAEAQLVAPDGAGSDYFGFSLALSCELLAVGTRLDDVGAATNQGTARLWWIDDGGNDEPETCLDPADLTRDGAVGGDDLATLLGAWGTAGADADLTGDGTVDGADLAALLGAWSAGA